MPFNIASYSFLTHLIANHVGLEAEEFIYFTGNNHIYMNHLEALTEQIQRTPFPFPKIFIRNKREHIEDYCFQDIQWVESYRCHDKIKMDMTA
jgi:thymidylate synthase